MDKDYRNTALREKLEELIWALADDIRDQAEYINDSDYDNITNASVEQLKLDCLVHSIDAITKTYSHIGWGREWA